MTPAMTPATTPARTPATARATRTSRWLRRSHRHHWLADTRDTDYSAGRLMGGYERRS